MLQILSEDRSVSYEEGREEAAASCIVNGRQNGGCRRENAAIYSGIAGVGEATVPENALAKAGWVKQADGTFIGSRERVATIKGSKIVVATPGNGEPKEYSVEGFNSLCARPCHTVRPSASTVEGIKEPVYV